MPNNHIQLKPLVGQTILGKYRILQRLGAGWEGEVYLAKEISTGVERAIKFFYPRKNKNNQTLKRYARKLHKLRNCRLVINYHNQDVLLLGNKKVHFLVSEYTSGDLLSDFIKKNRGHLPPFQALHLLYALVLGLEEIHENGEYHGDVHSGNIIVEHFGLHFRLKFIDFYNWDVSRSQNQKDDIIDAIKLFYDSLGGQKYYSKMNDSIKYICCGKRSDLILERFVSITKLRKYLEKFSWDI